MILTLSLLSMTGTIPQETTELHIKALDLFQPAVVTMYAPLDPDAVEGMCYSGNPNITATGTQVREGVAAACPERLSYGTHIYVWGRGKFVVEDTGGALRNDRENIRIDLFTVSRSGAFRFGRQELPFMVLGKED